MGSTVLKRTASTLRSKPASMMSLARRLSVATVVGYLWETVWQGVQCLQLVFQDLCCMLRHHKIPRMRCLLLVHGSGSPWMNNPENVHRAPDMRQDGLQEGAQGGILLLRCDLRIAVRVVAACGLRI